MNKLIILLLFPFLCGCWTLEKGDMVGQVIKVNEAGWFVKTSQAIVIRGGIQDGSGAFGKPTRMYIGDLKHKFESALLQKKLVKINYQEELFSLLCNGNEDIIANSIELIE